MEGTQGSNRLSGGGLSTAYRGNEVPGPTPTRPLHSLLNRLTHLEETTQSVAAAVAACCKTMGEVGLMSPDPLSVADQVQKDREVTIESRVSGVIRQLEIIRQAVELIG